VALAIAPARAISNDLWDDLQDRHAEFSEAVQEGHMLAEAWWTRKESSGACAIEARAGNAACGALTGSRLIGTGIGTQRLDTD
jgi:hypothetical protein